MKNSLVSGSRVFGFEPEDFSILTFGTHIHSLIKTIGDGRHGADIDFEGIELREVLAALLESGEGTLEGLEHYGQFQDPRGDADWLRGAEITDHFLQIILVMTGVDEGLLRKSPTSSCLLCSP